MENQIAGISIRVDPLTGELPNSWVVSTSQSLIIRSGSIDSIAKVQHFAKAVQRVHYKIPLKFIVCMLCLQREEWNLISAQDILLTWLHTFKDFSGKGGMVH